MADDVAEVFGWVAMAILGIAVGVMLLVVAAGSPLQLPFDDASGPSDDTVHDDGGC